MKIIIRSNVANNPAALVGHVNTKDLSYSPFGTLLDGTNLSTCSVK